MQRIKQVIKQNEQLVRNVSWLSVLQIANYLIPLILVPYLVRVLGLELYGRITYAQNIISYFTLIVNFGFEYSATRQVALYKNNNSRLRQIFWSVLIQKALLLLVSFLGLMILYLFFDKIYDNLCLYVCVFLLNIGFVLFPTWFYQGIEDMKKMAIFHFIIKLLGLILVFLFVRSTADYLYYPLLTSLSYVLFGGWILFYTVRKYKLFCPKIDRFVFMDTAKGSFPVFLNNVFVAIYTVSNITIFGLYYTESEVGIYNGAYRIIMAILMVSSMPINMALYPKISTAFIRSKKEGVTFLKKALRIVVPISLLLSLGTLLMSKVLVFILLGDEFVASVNVLRILSISPLLVITASMITVQGIYGMGLHKKAPFIGLTVAIMGLVLNLIFIPRYGLYAVAINWMLAQCVEILVAGYMVKRELKRKIE